MQKIVANTSKTTNRSTSFKFITMQQQQNYSCKHDEMYQKLLVNNKKWVEEKLEEDPQFFVKRAKGQQPKYLLIGCSDSRVPPDQVFFLLFFIDHVLTLLFFFLLKTKTYLAVNKNSAW